MFFIKTYRLLKGKWYPPVIYQTEASTIFYSSNSVHVSTNFGKDDQTELIVKDKIIYNSVLQVEQNKLGYFQTRRILGKRKEKIEGIQPLPLSLKYLDNIREEKCINKIEEKTPTPEVSKNVQFPYQISNRVNEAIISNEDNDTDDVESEEVDREIRSRNENLRKWMNSYDNLEIDISDDGKSEINYGTPDPYSKISDVPCGGCGALLHCKDTAIPGYIPSEIFKNASKTGAVGLEAIICQRCFFLKEYDMALQVRVSVDDYPKVLMALQKKKALVLLMVDLTDFPCSIWPGIADILGPKTPLVVIGNKIDLIPKDSLKFITNIQRELYDHIKLCGFGTSNILDITVISAKTGYGVEDLITRLQKFWQYKDVYLVGCTNVGKSSLFNALLQSDYCKFQASDLIQRATTSQWPGTTLNLLKFPIMRLSAHKKYMRTHRLIGTNKILMAEEEKRSDELRTQNVPENATLIGRIERTFSNSLVSPEKADQFTTQPNINDTSIRVGLQENHPDFVSSRWCYDTPGVVHPDQILHLLTLDELVKTLPKELIRPETFCVKPGTTLFIAGLARLDYINGPESVKFTVFRSKELPITICNANLADEIYNDLIGSDLFKVPAGGAERLKKWPGLKAAKPFVITGLGRRFCSKDIVLSSAGWISVTCGYKKDFTFQAWTPENRGIHLRQCILPNIVRLKGERIKNSVAYEQHKFI